MAELYLLGKIALRAGKAGIMNNKPVRLSLIIKGFFMYLKKIAKHSSQTFKVGQTFRSPLLRGSWLVADVADEQITVVKKKA